MIEVINNNNGIRPMGIEIPVNQTMLKPSLYSEVYRELEKVEKEGELK